MKKFDFHLANEDDLILIEASIKDYPLILALDTAASQTVIDWNVLFLAGCIVQHERELTNTVPVETAQGFMDVPIYDINNFNVLGIEKSDFSVLTYDF